MSLGSTSPMRLRLSTPRPICTLLPSKRTRTTLAFTMVSPPMVCSLSLNPFAKEINMSNDQIDTKVENLVTLLQLKGDTYTIGYLISFIKSNAYFMDTNHLENFRSRLDYHISKAIQRIGENAKSDSKIPV